MYCITSNMLIFINTDGEFSVENELYTPGSRFSLYGQGNLVIEALRPADAGVYLCSARNNVSSTPTIINIRLNIYGEGFGT